MNNAIRPYNEKAVAMRSSGGRADDEVSRYIAEGIEHCDLCRRVAQADFEQETQSIIRSAKR